MSEYAKNDKVEYRPIGGTSDNVAHSVGTITGVTQEDGVVRSVPSTARPHYWHRYRTSTRSATKTPAKRRLTRQRTSSARPSRVRKS
ncbi:hypothetical protein PENSPDRAFT_649131 [Peniophora sp. CONT]|nr:hypothetical protein PENSPDRAFT_649131 [Peniophora sp. CONT]